MGITPHLTAVNLTNPVPPVNLPPPVNTVTVQRTPTPPPLSPSQPSSPASTRPASPVNMAAARPIELKLKVEEFDGDRTKSN